jgi:iron complex outermembrane receptor protein
MKLNPLRQVPSRWLCFVTPLVCLGAGPLVGATATEFADMDIMELLNESVTSVSRKESPFNESAAAIFVINQEDIRRTGHNSLPEMLRLVPGMNVARIHGNEWAVSSRGFTEQYSNKLLVLIDGRTVYTPMFGGVYWNAQDMLLEDLDRIEVIRGPGATLWGSNAVNGVVNITSKSAKETQGGLITGSFGTEERPTVGVRYGGQIAPNVYYRTYVKTFDRRGFMEGADENADSWNMTRVGSRVDWETPASALITLQAEYYQGRVGEHFEGVSLTPPFTTSQNPIHDNYGGNFIARMTRELSPDSELTVQVYYDRFHQGDGDISETRTTLDLDVQHHFLLGDYNDIVWGVGSRYTKDRLSPTFYLTFDPEEDQEYIYTAFVQDELTLVPKRLKLTIGSKFEQNEHAGFVVQPSVRMLWMPTPRQSAWAAISRAVRVPSRYDRDARLNTAAFQPPASPPILVVLQSEKNVDPETVKAFEVGYRFEQDNRVSYDLTAFYNEYDGIMSYVPGASFFETTPSPPHVVIPLYFRNAVSGETYGVEAAVQWRVTDAWKLIAGYSWLHMRLHPNETSEGQNPEQQVKLRSYWDLPRNFQLNAAVYYTGSTSTPLKGNTVELDSILRFDLGLTWRPRPALELGIWGQNLLDSGHSEFGSFKTSTLTEIPRTVTGKITWWF